MNTAVIRLTNCHDCQYCDHNGMLQAHPKYICRNIECLEKAFKAKRLSRNLDIAIDEEIYNRLRNEILNG